MKSNGSRTADLLREVDRVTRAVGEGWSRILASRWAYRIRHGKAVHSGALMASVRAVNKMEGSTLESGGQFAQYGLYVNYGVYGRTRGVLRAPYSESTLRRRTFFSRSFPLEKQRLRVMIGEAIAEVVAQQEAQQIASVLEQAPLKIDL